VHGEKRAAFEAEMLVKKSPLTDTEIREIERLAGIRPPSRSEGKLERETLSTPQSLSRTSSYYRIASTEDPPGRCRSHAREVSPATDDRPFFNHVTRWSSLDLSVLRGLAGPNCLAGFLLGDRPVAD